MIQQDLNSMLASQSIEDLNRLVSLIGQVIEKKTRPQKPDNTLAGFAESYFAYIQDVGSEAYLRSIRLSFRHLINHFGEDRPLRTVGLRELEQFTSALKKSAPKGYSVYIRNLKAAFERAIEWEMLETNPFRKLKFKKTLQVKPVFLNRDELNSILKEMRNSDIRDMAIFAINTGCRLAEVTMLRWEGINLEAKEVTIGDEKFETKSRKQRIIPLSEEALTLVERRKKIAKSEYVFSKLSGFLYTKQYVSKLFKKACRKAGLGEELHFHTLRHSFASILAMKGVPTFVIKELMGHSSITTTEIYAHVNKEALHNAITYLNNKSNNITL